MRNRSLYRLLAVWTVSIVALATLPGIVPEASTAASSYVLTTKNAQIMESSEMQREGDVADNSILERPCYTELLGALPANAVAIGVSQDACDPRSWKGGSIYTTISTDATELPALFTICILGASVAPQRRSVSQLRKVSLNFDGNELLAVRATIPTEDMPWSVPVYDSLLTTIVLRDNQPHRLSLTAPEGVVWVVEQIVLESRVSPEGIQGIGYSPYRDGQYPGGLHASSWPKDQQIREDVFRLSHTCNTIRTYGATGVSGTIPRIAEEMGLRVFAGAWIDTSETENRKEIDAIVRIASEVDLDAIIVGNEYLLRSHERSNASLDADSQRTAHTKYLLSMIREVRRRTGGTVPLATAETPWDIIQDGHLRANFKQIAKELDYLLVHLYPFWNGRPIEGAADSVISEFQKLAQILENDLPQHDLQLVIGETGWPSAGRRSAAGYGNPAVASPSNQHTYYTEFLRAVKAAGIDYMYFDAFDELWKVNEGPVGQNWGYSYSDRANKYRMSGTLLSLPDLSEPIALADSHNVLLPYAADRNVTVYNEWPLLPTNDGTPGGFIPSGFMGNIDGLKIDECDRSGPKVGLMAARVSVNFDGTPSWAGIMWMPCPKDTCAGIDVHERLGGHSGPVTLSFWVKGQNGGERVRFGVGRDDGRGSLGSKFETDMLTLNARWTRVEIPLGQDVDLSDVTCGFYFAADLRSNRGNDIVFYLDHIQYEPNYD